jgi:hypothetical protein
VPQEQPSDDDPKSYKTNYQKEQVDSFKWSRHLSTTFGSINGTIFHILTSFDNVKNLDNKGEKNIKGLDIFQHMSLQQKIHGIAILPHFNMGGENESIEILSYFHPFPLN